MPRFSAVVGVQQIEKRALAKLRCQMERQGVTAADLKAIAQGRETFAETPAPDTDYAF